MITVVIVEDDPMVAEVNRSFLEKMNYFTLVGSAKTGEEAILLIEDKKPDLVLLDVYLPGISGIDVLHELRTRELPVDVIMITAVRDTKTVHQIFRFGAIDYLVKPFHFNRFELALNNYIKMWKKLKQGQSVSQADIDNWNEIQEMNPNTLPKGLSEITMKQVMMAIVEQDTPLTAEELAEDIGMARVTVRRYLDHLEKTNKINMQVKYGKVGRPSNYYYA